MNESISIVPTLPAEGFVRLKRIVGDPKADPPILGVLPVGRSTWWAGVKAGRYPAPTKALGKRVTAWDVRDIRKLLDDAASMRKSA